MNKFFRLIIVVVGLVVLYAVASWFIGTKVETIMDEQYALIEKNPSVRIVQRDYVRSVFSAVETTTFELVDFPEEFFQITVLTHIQHGPFPGFKTLAAATMETDLVTSGWPENVRKALVELFGDKKPLEIYSVVHLDGAGKTQWKVPAGEMRRGEDKRVAIHPLELNVDFTRNLETYTFKGQFGGFEYEDREAQVQMSDFSASGDAKRLFVDDPYLYVGKQHASVKHISVTAEDDEQDMQTVLLENIVMDADTPVDGDMLNIIVQVSAETLRVGEDNYGPARYDVSLNNLHAQTLSRLYVQLSSMQTDEYGMPEDVASLFEPAFELLTYKPEFRIDRAGFSTPEGKASLQGYVKFDDVQPEDANNPFILIEKLEAGADISTPEALLGKMVSREAESEEEAEELTAEMTEELNRYVEQGLISREADVLNVKIQFKEGELTLNGIPFNVMTMSAETSEDDFGEEDDDLFLEEEGIPEEVE